MKIYHGTNVAFEWVDINKCPPLRDFGRGFYLTKIHKHAEERAQDKVDSEGGTPVVMEFDFDQALLANPALRVKRFENLSEEWAQFVMYNRTRNEGDPEHGYDIVEGPVADDKMFRQFQRFRTNKIGLAKLVKTLEYREPTHQIAFCSEKVIEMLLDYNSDYHTKIETIVSELSAALMEDRNLANIEAMNIFYNSATFAHLADIATELYKKPWEEIYEMLKAELKLRVN